MSSTETMVDVMKTMGKIMGKTTEGININNVQAVVEDFNMKMEEQQGVNEMLEDAFGTDEDTADDVVWLLAGRQVP